MTELQHKVEDFMRAIAKLSDIDIPTVTKNIRAGELRCTIIGTQAHYRPVFLHMIKTVIPHAHPFSMNRMIKAMGPGWQWADIFAMSKAYAEERWGWK